MTGKRTFSAIIITKDRPEYLNNAIKSVKNQTKRVNEIIVVNNGKKPIKKHSGVKYIHTKFAIGSSNARNVGAKNSKSMYLAFLDDDDIWEKNYIKNSIKYLNSKTILLGRIFSKNSKKVIKIKSEKFKKHIIDLSNLYKKNPGIIGSNIIISKKAFNTIGGYDKNLPLGQDKAIVIEGIKKGFKVLRTNTKIYFNENTSGERNTDLIKFFNGKLIFYFRHKKNMDLYTQISYFILLIKNLIYGVSKKIKKKCLFNNE